MDNTKPGHEAPKESRREEKKEGSAEKQDHKSSAWTPERRTEERLFFAG